jgi:sec-independent protein translocase protein TatC
MFFSSKDSHQNPDDIFADTRMSFGDHIEELRKHLLKAVYGLLIVLLGGFVLDAVGEALGTEYIGLGRPMLKVIVAPAEAQVRAFYAKRNEQVADILPQPNIRTSPEEAAILSKKLKEKGLDSLSTEEKEKLRNSPLAMPVTVPLDPFTKAFGLKPVDPNQTEIEIEMQVYPAQLNYLANRGEVLLGNKQYITTLSVQEAFVVYFKVALLCSVVLASPWILFQMWSFVAAGLYPHERAYVYKFLWPSVGLFLAGVLLCQFVVLPGAVKALIGFNTWVELDPDLRLNEWLGFALLLPLVFGVSFQTPLVMFFLNRIGMFGWEDYWARWRGAVMVLAFFSALITPTPDMVTMLYLFIPMFGLYMIGVLVCKYFPPAHEEAYADEEQVAV